MNYWIWLAMLTKAGPVKKMKLLEKFKSPEKIYKAKKSELLKVEGISEEIVAEIEKSKDVELILKYEAYMKKHNITLINIEDKDYPEKLKNIYAPPITLFAKGNINLLNKTSIAIVGCRESSNYGESVAKQISKELSQNNIVVTSGMARGIDTASHIGTFSESGETIAVLGCGVDIVYPRENAGVYLEILKRGLIISEYIVGTNPEPSYFPQRNRIISGLSSGVVVVEAKKQSGTLITTDFALDQGKELYVVPGNINSPNSTGTNDLIKQGAKLITCTEDILEDLRNL